VLLSESLYVPDGGDLYHTIKPDAGGADLGVGRCACRCRRASIYDSTCPTAGISTIP